MGVLFHSLYIVWICYSSEALRFKQHYAYPEEGASLDDVDLLSRVLHLYLIYTCLCML